MVQAKQKTPSSKANLWLPKQRLFEVCCNVEDPPDDSEILGQDTAIIIDEDSPVVDGSHVKKEGKLYDTAIADSKRAQKVWAKTYKELIEKAFAKNPKKVFQISGQVDVVDAAQDVEKQKGRPEHIASHQGRVRAFLKNELQMRRTSQAFHITAQGAVLETVDDADAWKVFYLTTVSESIDTLNKLVEKKKQKEHQKLWTSTQYSIAKYYYSEAAELHPFVQQNIREHDTFEKKILPVRKEFVQSKLREHFPCFADYPGLSKMTLPALPPCPDTSYSKIFMTDSHVDKFLQTGEFTMPVKYFESEQVLAHVYRNYSDDDSCTIM